MYLGGVVSVWAWPQLRSRSSLPHLEPNCDPEIHYRYDSGCNRRRLPGLHFDRCSILLGNTACDQKVGSSSAERDHSCDRYRGQSETQCLVAPALRAKWKLRGCVTWHRRLSCQRDWFAPMFLSQGYAVLLPDSRAHGASEGRFVTYGLLEKYDVIAWANWMRRAGCRNLYGLGESLGASILIQAAAVQPVFAAIVAECPYADLRETAEYRVRQMLRMHAFVTVPAAKIVVSSGMLYANWVYGLNFQQVSPILSIAKASSPILLIHGLKDFRTPPTNSEKLASANPRDPLWLVPNAGHTGAVAAEPDEFRRRVLGWFAEH